MDDYIVWEAVLDMGGGKFHTVHQKDIFDDTLDFKPSYEELPREKLRLFRMIAVGSDRCVLQIPFKEGQGGRLIWRRRVQMEPGGEHRQVHLVGKRGAFINVIGPDFSIISDDNFSADNVILSEVEPVKGEENYVG